MTAISSFQWWMNRLVARHFFPQADRGVDNLVKHVSDRLDSYAQRLRDSRFAHALAESESGDNLSLRIEPKQ